MVVTSWPTTAGSRTERNEDDCSSSFSRVAAHYGQPFRERIKTSFGLLQVSYFVLFTTLMCAATSNLFTKSRRGSCQRQRENEGDANHQIKNSHNRSILFGVLCRFHCLPLQQLKHISCITASFIASPSAVENHKSWQRLLIIRSHRDIMFDRSL